MLLARHLQEGRGSGVGTVPRPATPLPWSLEQGHFLFGSVCFLCKAQVLE